MKILNKLGLYTSKEIKTVVDSFRDPLTPRGGTSDITQRLTGNRAFRSGDELYNLYATNGILQNIIDQPAEDSTREWIELKTNLDNEEESEVIKLAINKRMESLKVRQQLTKLVKFSRVYDKGGFMFYGVKGEGVQDMAEPIQTPISFLEYLNVAEDRDTVNVTVKNWNDITKKDYLETMFRVQGTEIHESRLEWIVNNFRAKDQTGISVVETVYEAVNAQDSALWSVGTLVNDMATKVFKSDDISNLADVDKMTELLTRLVHYMNTQGAIALRSDEDFVKQSYNITGLKDIFEFIFNNLSGTSRMPQKILIGQAHGVITGAEFDTMNYYAQIAKFQELQMRSAIQKIINLIVYETEGPVTQITDVSKLIVTFDFNSLWMLDPVTQADVNLKNSQRDQIDVTIGKADPDEVRQLDPRYAELEPRENFSELNMETPEINE